MAEPTITRSFNGDPDRSRYQYDTGRCSVANGWAQLDGYQDASHFGTWAHPVKLEIFTYAEGDETLCEYPDVPSFVAALREHIAWNDEQTSGREPHRRRRYMIDPFLRSIRDEFVRRDAADCIYPEFLTGEEA